MEQLEELEYDDQRRIVLADQICQNAEIGREYRLYYYQSYCRYEFENDYWLQREVGNTIKPLAQYSKLIPNAYMQIFSNQILN